MSQGIKALDKSIIQRFAFNLSNFVFCIQICDIFLFTTYVIQRTYVIHGADFPLCSLCCCREERYTLTDWPTGCSEIYVRHMYVCRSNSNRSHWPRTSPEMKYIHTNMYTYKGTHPVRLKRYPIPWKSVGQNTHTQAHTGRHKNKLCMYVESIISCLKVHWTHVKVNPPQSLVSRETQRPHSRPNRRRVPKCVVHQGRLGALTLTKLTLSWSLSGTSQPVRTSAKDTSRHILSTSTTTLKRK